MGSGVGMAVVQEAQVYQESLGIALCYSKVQGRDEEKALTNVKCFVSVLVSVLRRAVSSALTAELSLKALSLEQLCARL